MSDSQNTQNGEVQVGTRVYLTGSCDGFDTLREALAQHPELELVGASEQIQDAAAALAGGHLDCVLHATRSLVAAGGRAGRDPRAHAGADPARRLRRGLGPARARRSRPTSPTSCSCRS